MISVPRSVLKCERAWNWPDGRGPLVSFSSLVTAVFPVELSGASLLSQSSFFMMMMMMTMLGLGPGKYFVGFLLLLKK